MYHKTHPQTLTFMSFQSCMTYFLLRNKIEDILKNIGSQTTLEPIDLHCVDKKRMSKYLYLYSTEKSRSFGTTRE